MAIVIGKGPSLKGRNLGSWIDSFSTIVRLVGGITDDDYGHECDYLLTTTSQYKQLKHHKLHSRNVIWVYKTRGKMKGEYPAPRVRLDGEVVKYIKWYTKHYDRSKLDTTRTWYPSKGTVAIIAVMCILDDDVIAAGFDTVLMGEPWDRRMTHDWAMERELLKRVARHKNKKLLVLQ